MTNRFRTPESYKDDTERTVILVDYSNLLYRAWFVSSKRANVAYEKFFDMLRLCIKRSKQKDVPVQVIFAGESKTKLKRSKISKDYKKNRKTVHDPKFQKFREGLEELIRFIGYAVIDVDGAEADDIIASYVAQHCHRCECKVPCKNCDCHEKYKTDVVIFSGDRDLQQCLAWDRTFIYRAPGIFVTKDTLEADLGFPVGKYAIYKALTGDVSDNIKGVEGFGPAKAKLAVAAQSVGHDIWEMSGQKGKEEFELSLALISLDTKLDLYLDHLYRGEPYFDESAFLKKYGPKVLLEVQRFREEFR